jgi:hypothetical protein
MGRVAVVVVDGGGELRVKDERNWEIDVNIVTLVEETGKDNRESRAVCEPAP